MRDLVDTTEMYLRTVYELEEEGITPLRARIAERLEQSGPTVSQTVARMERDGLIVVEHDRSLSLTEEGRRRATAVMRKHRLAERLLTDVLKLDLDQVHDEACRWEHVMSEEVERRVVAVLDNPSRSPFGNPIPALEEIGAGGAEVSQKGTRATDLRLREPARAKVVQVSEILQDGALPKNAGQLVGAVVTLTPLDGGALEVATQDGNNFHLTADVAHALRVEPEN
ncbi:metal-dependent regulator [Corynebacterium sp. zg912]|uniref:Diphtheria toxin repressor n=1 Tax=Corynebacterium wankanglinii TaxID=2735136 RepID=A0A7H0K8P4_9CORY|nr:MULTISPECIES: metal-dependent transcriptional regulator [Corynebacterium]MBA1834847.1 metal-dependent transcriptional regulator [Corynebacterium wankanglinii]MBA1837083.1 metal-dependent transcriptional regulator [Corynebacterium wankanglinii]MCR5928058.1 metal-dependent regulator [Corynebacterium sp. zg912]QNP93660.1 metal-dependent transcriptional regulator [Corynebacterium wankanglinii]